MRGRGKILYISLIICLRLATCAAITVLVDYGVKHCFYIDVAQKTEYEAKVFLLSGGSVGFSIQYHETSGVQPILESELVDVKIDNRPDHGSCLLYLPALLLRTLAVGRQQFESTEVALDVMDHTTTSAMSTRKVNGPLLNTDTHIKPSRHNGYFEDKVGMGRGGQDEDDDDTDLAGPYIHTISAVKGEYEICLFSDRRLAGGTKRVNLEIVQKDKDPEENTNHDVDPVEEHVQDLEQLLLDIQSEQEKQEKGISGRSKAAYDNHISMEKSAIIETVVVVVVSVGQIILVRRWFQGKGSLLKRWA